MAFMLWIVAGLLAGAVFLSREWNIPEKAKRYLPKIEEWAYRRQIPVDVLLTWASLESNFNPLEYNPEPSAIDSWSCEVAGKERLWGRNPRYADAVATCRGESGRWGAGVGWGSYGMLQVARIVATELGVLSGRSRHELLFDLDTNLNAGTAEINDRRRRLFPHRVVLTGTEWALVRAAYVGGPRIFSKNPSKAQEIAMKFLIRLQEIRRKPTS